MIVSKTILNVLLGNLIGGLIVELIGLPITWQVVGLTLIADAVFILGMMIYAPKIKF